MRLCDQLTLFLASKLFITIKLKHDKQTSWKDIFSSKCVIHIIIILTKASPAKYQFGFGKYKPPKKFSMAQIGLSEKYPLNIIYEKSLHLQPRNLSKKIFY
jgi:hypothetical protein